MARAAVALEIALGLLQILHRCSCLKPAVLEVQNDCRCGSNSARVGPPVPLKSMACSVSICRGAGALQVDVQPVNSSLSTVSVT